MRQWKIALSLAIVGALAAPFAFGTYKNSSGFYSVPLTAQERADLEAVRRRCDSEDNWSPPRCSDALSTLVSGARLYWSDLQYLRVNAFFAALTFVSVFILAYLIPMLARGLALVARRYWKWLNLKADLLNRKSKSQNLDDSGMLPDLGPGI